MSRLSPVIDPGTGTFRVTIELDPGQRSLRPGQFVGVELEVDRHEDVVTVAKKAVVYEDGRPVVYRLIPRPEEEEKDSEKETKDKERGGLFGISFDMKGPAPEDEDEQPASPWVAERVPVELGLVDNERAEVVDGVLIGDKIIVIGQSNLKDGAPVKTAEMIEADEAQKRADEASEGDGDAAVGEDGTESAG